MNLMTKSILILKSFVYASHWESLICRKGRLNQIGKILLGMMWNSMVWYGMVCYVRVWYGGVARDAKM